MTIPVQGSVRFGPGELMLYLDSANAVPESNEANNLIDLYHTCLTDAGRSPAVRLWSKWQPDNPADAMSTTGRIFDTNRDGIIDGNDVPVLAMPAHGFIALRRGDTGELL